jgi:predicted dehydrogenase
VRGPFRLALIGAGGIGHTYAEAARSVPEIDVGYVADLRGDVAASLAHLHGATAVTEPESLADPSRVDLALICTPTGTHEHLATAFLRAGVPVMCEKPLAADSATARRILAVAAATGTQLTMASKFRFVSDVIGARSIIQSGTLGEIIRVEVAFASQVDMSRRWNSDPTVSGGGVLIDNGTHAVDLVRYILGPVDSVLATTETSTPGLQVEDTAAMLLRTRDGHIGSVDVSWALDRMTDRYLAAFGTEGSLEVGWRQSRVRLTSSPTDVAYCHGYDKVTALADNLRNVAQALRGEADFVVTPADAIASVAVIQAAYESVRTGQWACVRSRKRERLSA